jgi:Plant mobile domain
VKKATCRSTSSGPLFHDSHSHDATVLIPRDPSASVPPLHLLGDAMMSGRSSTWDKSHLRTCLRRFDRQVEWTRYILMRERGVLQRARIYDLVYLSLFDYSMDDSLLHAFSERWGYTTNTLFLDDREMSLTLWELRQLTGLPIVGHYYDEYLISDEDLEVPTRFPDSLRTIYGIYDTLRGHHDHVPFRCWIDHFTAGYGGPTFTGPVLADDPLGLGAPVLHFVGDLPPQDSICFPAFDREVYLTAFLSWWICYFLIPSTPACTIRPSVFVMASRIARGQRVALAIPVLANIFRSLRGMVSSQDPSRCREWVPYHFICGWLHMHFSGLYQPSIFSETMRSRLPLLADMAGAIATSFTALGARFFFHDCKKRLRTTRARLSTLYSGRLTDRVIIDEITFSRSDHGIRARLDDWEYLVSVRCGFLPLRLRDHAVIEPYSPHRCAHQFSLDQDIPLMLRRPPYLAVDMVGLGWCYSFLFRTGTGSQCQMASSSRTYIFSQGYQQWYHTLIATYQSIHPKTVVEAVCPDKDGRRKNEIFVSSILGPVTRDADLFPAVRGEPLDFQGLDSRFSFIPFRSFIAGTFFLSIVILFFRNAFNSY